MESDVVGVEQRVEVLEQQMGVAARGDTWTKRQLALFAIVIFVAGYFGRLTWEWATSARPPAAPAVLARPAGSGGP